MENEGVVLHGCSRGALNCLYSQQFFCVLMVTFIGKPMFFDPTEPLTSLPLILMTRNLL